MTSVASDHPTTFIAESEAAGLDYLQSNFRLIRRGSGAPVLFLHDEVGLQHSDAFLNSLAELREIAIPVHPGYEGSARLAGIHSVVDIARFYVNTLSARDSSAEGGMTVIGASLGGWIALEMTTLCPHLIDQLILIGPLGVKLGDRSHRDFVDVFAINDAALSNIIHQDPQRAANFLAGMSDNELLNWFRNREATAFYGWRPYLHDPVLRTWTRSIGIPTTLIYGLHDRLVADGYYAALARHLSAPAIAVEMAGHYPHIDAPDAVSRIVADALDTR